MAMTFSMAEKTLSKSIRKVQAESDLKKKALAVKELSVQAKNLGTHISRFARIAWLLDMLFLFFAVFVFCVVVLFEFIDGILPPKIYQIIEPIYNSEGFTAEIKAWLYCILWLVAIPIVFDFILSAVCEHTSVTVEKTAAASKKSEDIPDDGREKLRYVEKTLDNVQSELNPANSVPLWIGGVLGILLMIPTGIVTCFACARRNTSTIINLISTVLAGIILFLLILGIFYLIFWLKQHMLALFFSSWRSRRKARKLRDEFLTQLPKYKKQFDEEDRQRKEEERRQKEEELERKRYADLRAGAELYKRATAGSIIDENIMAQAAEKGDPRANLYIGMQMLEDADGLTTSGIVALYSKAKRYLKIANDAAIPDGIFLYMYAKVVTESHNEDDWRRILRRVREIRKSELSIACANVYDLLVSQLYDVINEAKAASASLPRPLGGGGSGSYSGSSGSESDRMHDDLDAVQRAMRITEQYGEDWKGYDPESFPDSGDIW